MNNLTSYAYDGYDPTSMLLEDVHEPLVAYNVCINLCFGAFVVQGGRIDNSE